MWLANFLKKRAKKLTLIFLLIIGVYGLGRLYFKITDGFTIDNISSDLAYNPKWDTSHHSTQESELISSLLSQKFKYLGKGCQSYVFASEDGQYVLKFFKYQRFRQSSLINFFSFIPLVNQHRTEKIELKQKKLDAVFSSWKLAFEELQPETQLVYVHLNKTHDLKKKINIQDKIGIQHSLNADDMEFSIQRRAIMMCSHIKELMAKNDLYTAKIFLSRIIQLIISEYQRGYADNDHALMQNTGVVDGFPIHIDVGQFVKNPDAVKPKVYKQDLFNKTYKFRLWLEKHYPELAQDLELKLRNAIGEKYSEMRPHFQPGMG